MSERERDARVQAALERSAARARRAERPPVGTQRAPQEDVVSGVSCRVGDGSCAGAHASTIRRSTGSQPDRAPEAVLRLQREYGNQYARRVLEVARQVEGEGELTPEVESAIQRKRGGGQALDGGVRGGMESAFGVDFGGVRVHTDAEADGLNRSLSARAFTTGSDIFFRQGAYQPGSSAGRELLAHELTHVVQQEGAEVRRKLTLGQPGDRYEQEAEQTARAVLRQGEGGSRASRMGEEEEEALETSRVDRPVSRQAEEEEEEPIQAMRDHETVRRQEEAEEEEEVMPMRDADAARRQEEEEEEMPV